MSDTEPTWPEFVKPGAYVRATAKDSSLFTVEFLVDRIDSDGELVVRAAGENRYIGLYPAKYIVEQITPPLPKAKGVYIDNNDEVWVIDEDGGPLRWWSRSTGLTEPDYADPDGLTFTRLVPEGASA